MATNDVAQMAELLAALTQPNTDAIRAAELTLKPILKDPRCVPALLEVLKGTGTQPAPVRHIAAVLLRKRISGHYAKFDAPTKVHVKAEILSILSNEPERSVRHGTAGVAAAIAKLEVGSPQSAGGGNNWPELLQFISMASDPSTSNPDARELGFFLLGEMNETVAEHMRDQFPAMAQLFASALVPDTPAAIQNSAVSALGQLLSYLADEEGEDFVGGHFAALIPSILSVAAQCQARGDEDTVSVTLDVLYDLAYSPSDAVTTHLPIIVQYALGCLADDNLDMGVRDSAALVIATLAEAKPKTLGKSGNVEGIVETLFNLIENSNESAAGALFESNPAWKEDEQDEDDAPGSSNAMDSPTATSMAQGTLDMLACELPKKYIFQAVVTRCVARLASPQPNHRKAGIACLGVIAEGCSEPLREHLPDVMAQVFAAAGDAESQVRECACFCLGQLSEHCQPEILSYSSQILPIVFALLDDTTVAVQATSCYVLEMFCERLEPEGVRPLLDSLVKKLAAMLEGTTKRSVQEMAVAALAATAVAAEEEFVPYVAGVADLMQKMMSLQEEKMYSLRGRALECMGHMAIAVGKENFRPYFSGTMQCACEGLTFDSTELHEFAYAVFANLAKVMGDEFSPILPELVPHLVTVIGTDEGQIEQADETDRAGQFSALDDSDDEGAASGYVLHVRTALFEAKKGAITALGEMAAHTGAAFVPFLEDSIKVLQKAATNWHPLIKCEVAQSLPSMIVPSVAANHDGEIAWEKGDVTCANPMSEHTIAVVSAVLNDLLTLMDDDDKETVGKACEGIQSVIELCGPHALIPVANGCLQKTHDILSRKSPCQQGEEDEEPDDDDDHDSFMTSVCDLVGAFARVMGSQFNQYLPQFLPPICGYAKTSRPPSDRSMAIGCLGEIAQELESSISEHWESVFLPAVLSGLADEDDNVKRNAAFTAGVCCEGLGASVANQYPQLLQALSPLFSIDSSVSDSSAACVDNAAAAVSRMIMATPGSVPMPQVLPALLQSLPLKNDMTENETVYKCLLGLLQMNQPDAVALKAEFSRIFQAAVEEGSKVDDDIKAQLAAALPSLA
mmetsp:Transcript_37175/g.54715  ORF Transcript_37175/g.54715 Transcript_37175/m.54715 type:complete len:1080 (-) Transcript_37175:170-3409(-)|eukprot:CAMPEP_0195527346 /NCGR_PEP_ID=MMETSP0794_2-20130614/28965_1 /TAXON_ID=515487 /ORGANISM="Stephanopyxis turris, Strain CCMP 815" /LENGTH=1079 /DNA_ID=CAMNT_0040658239 /DNA_START=83 /DNA_END=3322 /DNA_ORIENTATION=+